MAAADNIVVARGALETETTFFREAGNRKKFFDKVNAARKSTYGELASMPHANMGLPASFANQFFRHDTGKDEVEAPTLESVDEEIAALEQQARREEGSPREAGGRGGARGRSGV